MRRRWAAVLVTLVMACSRDRSNLRPLDEEKARDATQTSCAHRCGAECPDLRRDPKHCGACDVACVHDSRCLAGACTTEADATTTPFEAECTPGKRLAFHCPASAPIAKVWGTLRYTDDSSACSAAMHAGVIDLAKGGDVAVEMRPGLPSFVGSARFGVTSGSWAVWPCSFVFVGGVCKDGAAACDDACVDLESDEWHCGMCGRRCADEQWCVRGACTPGPPIDANVTASRFPCVSGATHTFECAPSSGVGSVIWGTDVYTNDSSICTAAVHAGKITFASGGRVTIEILPGRPSYAGTLRYGVRSGAYGVWTCSYQFK